MSKQSVILFPRRKKSESNCEENKNTKFLGLTTPRSIKRQGSLLNDEETTSPKRSPSTPSTLISRVKICNETTNSPSNTFKSRRTLFGSKENEMRKAQSALHSEVPNSLPEREKEMKFLQSFLEDHYQSQTSASLYISGPPGSGKTASLSIILSQTNVEDHYKTIYVNCTSMRTTRSIYNRILEELHLKKKYKSAEKPIDIITKYITTSKIMILLVLDEIDQLETKTQCVLYTIFEWPSIANSKLVLIGIANALNLTDRTLPRLQGNLTLKPTLLHFPSYSKQQIVSIVTQRLKQVSVDHIFADSAIQLLAGKVAAVSGDIRRALDIARRVIDLSENISVDETEPGQKVQLADVLHVINNVYGTTQVLNTKNTNSQTDVNIKNNDDGFPIQQKLMICSLLLVLKRIKSKSELTIGKLHEVYKKICEKRNIFTLDLSEFLSMCSLVETRGIFLIKGTTRNRLSKVILQWDEKEIRKALQDKTLLAGILTDESLL